MKPRWDMLWIKTVISCHLRLPLMAREHLFAGSIGSICLITFSSSCFIENRSMHIVTGLYQKVRSLPNWVWSESMFQKSQAFHLWTSFPPGGFLFFLKHWGEQTGQCCTASRHEWNWMKEHIFQPGSVRAVRCLFWQLLTGSVLKTPADVTLKDHSSAKLLF